MKTVMEVRNIRSSSGGIVAESMMFLSDVRARRDPRHHRGRTAAAKSALFNCILSQLRPTAGDVHLAGEGERACAPRDLNKLGVSRTFQLLRVFPQLTVRENLILAGQEHQGHDVEAPVRTRATRGSHGAARKHDRVLPTWASRR